MDELLDDVFPILEQIATRLDSLEEAVLRDPKPKLLSKAFAYRSNIRAIRSTVWPLRHQVRMLLRQHQPLLGPDAEGGFRDMGEIVEMLFENCELLRHQCDSITQAYAASVGNRMNQVMKTLTILTSIFAPLTFIGGIYGMNFDNMPELHWRYGYLYALLLMLVIGGTGWLWGGIIGAVVFKTLHSLISAWTPQYWTFWLGLFLVLLMLLGRERLLRPWTWGRRA